MNSIVGGLADPLALGSKGGRISVAGGTFKDYAIATVQEGSRAVAVVSVGAAVGKGMSMLARQNRTGRG